MAPAWICDPDVNDVKPTLTMVPQTSVFIGDSVTLICEVHQSTGWEFIFITPKNTQSTETTGTKTIRSLQVSDGGEYWCRARRRENPQVYTQYSEPITVTVQDITPTLTVQPRTPVFTGDTVTLICEIHQSTGWEFIFITPSNTEFNETTGTKTIRSVQVSDGGEYTCRARRKENPQDYTQNSELIILTVQERPTPQVSVWPDYLLFRGETVNLRCVINEGGVSSWQYSWYKDDSIIQQNKHHYYTIRSVTESDAGKYTCKGTETRGSRYSHISNAVTLTVSDKPQTVLSVSPQQWLTEGDSVTLMCEVINSSTGWTFSWFTVQSLYSVNKDYYQLMSNSSGGSKGIYTVSSVTVKHTGVYMCRAERGDPVYHTEYSNTQTLWITGVSPSVSLIIRPNRSQHFSSESLSLSCEDHSNSTGWTVRRYTDKLKPCSSSDWRSTGTTSTCTIRSLSTSDTGVYWCQSESGEKLHPVNISVHNADVILDSPVHPVTEGDPLTLRCLYRDKNPSNMRAEFYKDGSVVQNQTTGDMMIIPTVSKSHEGFYYCKHPERGESPKSWISVRAAGSSSRGLNLGLCLGLSSGVVFLIFFLVLLWCYKKQKFSQSPSAVSQQQNISQTSDQKQTEDGYNHLHTGDAHIYNSITNKDTSAVTQAGPSDAVYSQVNVKKKKLKSKGL
ncbi:leukocyte immunoglobulin-like receptor subfamily A member 1 [Paramisgurnus dabryanus]|uniref:leukocyte immunoglobulin-like receptor subfamily A member 1 n=1 Tax=Paramisgurnus dabryanus TaxID=90735 RepID=UPI003CCFB2EC